LSFEIIGIFAIGFASTVISKRLSLITGLLFCVVSSLIFSVTHLIVLPFQSVTWTIFGNLGSSILVLMIGVFLYPVWGTLLKQITDFWQVPPTKRA
jgi:hypothetical protein